METRGIEIANIPAAATQMTIVVAIFAPFPSGARFIIFYFFCLVYLELTIKMRIILTVIDHDLTNVWTKFFVNLVIISIHQGSILDLALDAVVIEY